MMEQLKSFRNPPMMSGFLSAKKIKTYGKKDPGAVYPKRVKPFLDFTISLSALLVLSPLLLVLMTALAISHRGNPFFFQKRPGKHGRIFKIIKFKTMNDKTCVEGHLLSDYERLTFVGKIVRKTSMDELPQLLNVIKGDMSIIGPRPLLPEYLPLYNEVQQRRHLVKPGITGWAQVNGRNALSWEEKFYYDVEYVERMSARLDVKITLITMKKIVARHGVNANNYMTMEAFKGTAA